MSQYNHDRLDDHFYTRRDFLQRCGTGMGALALGSIFGNGSPASAAEGTASAASLNPLTPRDPHFTPKAKHVIHLFMNGGPSHLDTFDPKPMLTKHHGKQLPMD